MFFVVSSDGGKGDVYVCVCVCACVCVLMVGVSVCVCVGGGGGGGGGGKLTKVTLYLSLTGELWNVGCEDFGENCPCYNSTALYLCLSPQLIRILGINFIKYVMHVQTCAWSKMT